MSSQHLDYWVAQNPYAQQAQAYPYEIPGAASDVSSIHSSPVSGSFDSFPPHIYQTPFTHVVDDLSYPMPMTPSDFGSADESFYESPRPAHTQLSYHAVPAPAERTHTTSGVSDRRRAQNRAAQRAFRERKEKHAKDLESQLAALTDKYRTLEMSHQELHASYDKLRKTIEVLTKDEAPSNSATLRKLLDILHGEAMLKAT